MPDFWQYSTIMMKSFVQHAECSINITVYIPVTVAANQFHNNVV